MRLLDTNIVSFVLRGDSRRLLYVHHLAGRELAISFMTQGELFAGAELGNWGPIRWKRLDFILQDKIVIHSDQLITSKYALIRKQRRRQPMEESDAWIAATALRYDLELVTHNPSDFTGIAGLRIITEHS